MEIGVIGMNEYAKSLCKHWISRGHRILFADLHLYPGGYALAEELGPHVSLSLPEKIAHQAEVIVVAVPSQHLAAALDGLASVEQKIIIDLIIGEESVAAYENTYAEIQTRLPNAKVVKLTPEYPHHVVQASKKSTDTLYTYGNDHLAQRMVRWFIDGSRYQLLDLSGVIL